MSALSSSTEPTFDDADLASLLGVSPLRVALFIELRRRRCASLPELAEALGCTRNAIAAPVKRLESLGMVTSSLRRTPTCCKPVRYYDVAVDKWEDLAWELFDLLSGSLS